MYFTDYHVHSKLSMDGMAPLPVMAEHAWRAGMNEICITDHFDLIDQYAQPVHEFDWTPHLEQYHKTLSELPEGKLKIQLGLEYGMGHLEPAVSEQILNQPELDFVIGSIHNLSPEKGGTDLYYMDFSTVEACTDALNDYFTSMEKLAKTPYYDVLGHIIYPIRYMHGLVSIHPWLDQVTEIMRIAVESGRGIEVNTYRGLTVNQWRIILERYKSIGGEIITVGSDAHDPTHAGGGVLQTYRLLQHMGFRYVASYDKRNPNMIAI